MSIWPITYIQDIDSLQGIPLYINSFSCGCLQLIYKKELPLNLPPTTRPDKHGLVVLVPCKMLSYTVQVPFYQVLETHSHIRLVTLYDPSHFTQLSIFISVFILIYLPDILSISALLLVTPSFLPFFSSLWMNSSFRFMELRCFLNSLNK